MNPYGRPGEPFGRTDPHDARYDHQGAANDYYRYPTDIEIDTESEIDSFDPNLSVAPYHPYPSTGIYSPDYSVASGQSSVGFWGSNSGSVSRGISSVTAPDDDFLPARSGPRCIFYYIDCKFRSDNHDDWIEHIYYDHFSPHESSRRPNFGRMPTSWTCRFRGCNSVMRNDEHQALWDEKLAHIFGHLKYDRGRPEEIAEDSVWLKYYETMRLCHPVDVYGGALAPPPTRPYTQGINAPRKVKKLSRGHPHQDAPGEPMLPFHGPPPTASSYMAPPPHYPHPPPEQQPHTYNQPMQPGSYLPPGPGQYYGHPGRLPY